VDKTGNGDAALHLEAAPHRSWVPLRAGDHVARKHVSVIGVDGSPLRRLKLDPTKDYQPMP